MAIVLWRSIKAKKEINRILDSRVRERTKELEVNRDTLQRSFLERDAIINKASIDIRSSIATIKGLCLLGIKEIQHPNAQGYLEKVEKTSEQVSNVINRIFTPYKIEDHPNNDFIKRQKPIASANFLGGSHTKESISGN